MAARTSMADLITRLRRLIGDQGDSPVWDDDALQDALDVYQVTHRYENLVPSESVAAGGVRTYKDFYSVDGLGDWEADEELTDGSYNVLPFLDEDDEALITPNRIVGHWAFITAVSSLVIRISGKSYDLYGTAADVCRQWAAQVKLEFDFRTKERQYSRSQQYKMLIDLAETYDAKRLPQSAVMIRTDVAARGSVSVFGLLQ